MIVELYALTPVIMKSDEGYWKNKISLDEYERLLKENLIKNIMSLLIRSWTRTLNFIPI